MAGEEAMIVAGVGFRRGTSADEIEHVVRVALGTYALPAGWLQAIATEQEKAAESALPEAARRLGVPLIACSAGDLERVADQILTSSNAALKAKGLPSIAEASAIVVAGRNARLLGARVATECATCAIATGEGR
jgi:cobalt-precorrin 5A hydrolase